MNHEKITFVLLIIAIVVSGFNMYSINISNAGGDFMSGAAIASVVNANDVLPRGVPNIYGKELGISFDDVSASDSVKAEAAIAKLAGMDNGITLNGKEKERYINILYRLNNGISCEYCCGAKSVIFENGQAACGCAHSYAMRGLTKYLLTKHGSEYTDEEILEEIGKWKTLFFPGQLTQKAQVLRDKNIEINYVNLASNKYRGIEKGAVQGSGMVGGC
jgi:hypothetical protein